LDAVRKLPNSCSVVLITTDKVYENMEWHYPYRETDRLGGFDPYSASKAAAELVISCYRNSFFNTSHYSNHRKAIASARAGNVIGGGDWSQNRIIPDIVRGLTSNQSIEIRNPLSVRPWQHVLEPLFGYLLLSSKLVENPIQYADSWNFGPNIEDNLTVKDIVEIAVAIWGEGSYNTLETNHRLHEAKLLKLDINKTTNDLGWKPKWNARKAIEKTIAWYRNDSVSASAFTRQQIEEYL
jgi:CDP-glucose 4,6-dehydratase